MKYMPGMGSVEIKPEMMEKAEREMKLFRAVIGQ